MMGDTQHRGNVIKLGQRASAGLRVANELRAYWEALRAGRLIPSRSDISPRGIDQSLEYAFILERVATGMGRIRVAGTHLNSLMGMEVRGMPLSSFFSPVGRKQITELTETMFQTPAIIEVDLNAETAFGKPKLTAKLLLLPLKSDLGDVTRCLGCIVTEGDIGRAPRRFDVVAAHVAPIISELPIPREEPKQVEPTAKDLIDGWARYSPPKKPIAPRTHSPQAPPNMTPEERRAMFQVVPKDV